MVDFIPCSDGLHRGKDENNDEEVLTSPWPVAQKPVPCRKPVPFPFGSDVTSVVPRRRRMERMERRRTTWRWQQTTSDQL